MRLTVHRKLRGVLSTLAVSGCLVTGTFANEPDARGGQGSLLGIRLDEGAEDAAVVASVEPNSPAQRAGVRPSDVIIAVNGDNVSSPDEFVDAATRLPAGSRVDLGILRAMTLQIMPPGRNAAASQLRARPPANVEPMPAAPVTPAIAPVPTYQAPAYQAPTTAPQKPARRGLLRRGR